MGEHLVSSGLNIENNYYLYGGKELQDRFGVNLYDSGARFQANTGAFLSADPLAEKYYGISPYAYCAGNPVNLVDPEGKIIEFSEGVSNEFKERVLQAILFMALHGTTDNLKKLANSNIVYYLSEGDGKFNSRTNVIQWNPYAAYEHESTGLETSPVTVFAHELAHAARYNSARESNTIQEHRENFINAEDPQYGTREEREVITQDEQVAAKKHGEISDGQVTRTDHKGNKKTAGWKDVSVWKQVKAVRKHNSLFLNNGKNNGK